MGREHCLSEVKEHCLNTAYLRAGNYAFLYKGHRRGQGTLPTRE